MGLFDVFSKGGKYFGKAIEPKCEYCEYGNRARDGDKVLCTKKGLVDAGFHCPKFLYSPLKRIPVKQLERVGWLEGDYEEKDFAAIQKKKEEEAKAAEAAAKAEKSSSKNAKASKPAQPAKQDKSAPANGKDAKPAVEQKPAAETKPVQPAPAEVKDAKPAEQKPAQPAEVKDAKPAEQKPAQPAQPAPAEAKDTKPAEQKPVPNANSTTAQDLASLAAMAEAAGAYNPEPVPAEDAAQNSADSSALSSM